MAIKQTRERTSEITFEGGIANVPSQITEHINGNDVQVNHQSLDKSVAINSPVMNYIRELRDEVKKTQLSDEQLASAVEVLDEMESQIISGKLNWAILTLLLASLPATESNTSIGDNLLEALKAAGII